MPEDYQRHTRSMHTQDSPVMLWRIAVLFGVVLLIVGVLWLKNRPATLEMIGAKTQPTLGAHINPTTTIIADAVVSEDNIFVPRAGELPEAYLDRMLEARQPVFAFFHSNTCYQCTEMAKIVDQVYPDFADQVALVDVDVYDGVNQSLLQRAGIRVIPTLIFFDRSGQGNGTTGMMPTEQLQATLEALATGGTP